VSATQLTATITATDIQTAGTASVTVFNATPGGGTSNSQTFTIEYPSPTVTGITPGYGVNNASINITDLAGTGFRDGATVKLTRSGQTDIDATSVVVASATKITCTFGLNGKATGYWNVVVTNSDTKSGTLTNGFEIQAVSCSLTLSGQEVTWVNVNPDNPPDNTGKGLTCTVTGNVGWSVTVATSSGDVDGRLWSAANSKAYDGTFKYTSTGAAGPTYQGSATSFTTTGTDVASYTEPVIAWPITVPDTMGTPTWATLSGGYTCTHTYTILAL
jgi:hypothetical protein